MDDRPAEDRTDQAGKPPDRAEDPLDTGSLVHVEEVAHDGHGDGLDRAGAQPLDRPEEDERGHAAGVTAEEGAAQEKNDADEHHRLAAVKVREFAVDRQGNGRREHVGGEHPGVEVDPARSPTAVGIAVDTTVISMAARNRPRSKATTVRGRLVSRGNQGSILRVDA